MKRFMLILAALCLTAAPLAAQKNKELKRPKLDAAADTNDWNAYYVYGLTRLQSRPDESERAFYWASRLNPAVPDPLFAQWVAHWMKDENHMYAYLLGDRHAATSKDAVRNDSLVYRATLKNPFVNRALEKRMWDRLDAELRLETGGRSSIFGVTGDPWVAGWFAYMRGDMGLAVRKFQEAVDKKPNELSYRLDLADVLYHTGNADGAVSELDNVISEMHKRDLKKLVIWYNSKAQIEYRVGMVYFTAQRLEDAKAAFGRALSEDLSYYMAHARLGDIALAQHDTAGALLEYGSAAELNADDPVLRQGYGLALLASHRATEAAAEFRKAIEIDPYFAMAHYELAIALEMDGKNGEAAQAYQDFIEHASRQFGVQIVTAKQKIQDLSLVAKNTGGNQ